MKDVFADIALDMKPARETKGEPKRYISFTRDEWHEKLEKAVGRSLSPSEAKEFIIKLLNGIADGTLKLSKS